MTRQLATDVNLVEEAELRRLEDGAPPALSAKVGRVRGPSVLQKRRMEEQSAIAADEAAAAAKRRKSSTPRSPIPAVSVSSSVKAVKTGMVLARTRLFEPASGVVAAREHRSALIGMGTFRDCETVGSEAPVGALATGDMPKCKHAPRGARSTAQFQHKFKTWMRAKLTVKFCCAPFRPRCLDICALTFRVCMLR